MKSFSQAVFILILGVSTLASATKSEDCEFQKEKLTEISQGLASTLILNGDVVLDLLDSAIKSTRPCQIETKPSNAGSWGTCGYSEPVAIYKITIAGANQSWTLSVAENQISCGPKEFLLSDITGRNGQITAVVNSGDSIIAQVTGCGNESATDYKAIGFSYKQDHKIEPKANLVNMNDSLVCPTPTTDEKVITFSRTTLGLGQK